MQARIVVADEHILVRRGLMAMIHQLPPQGGDFFSRPVFTLQGHADSLSQLLTLLAEHPVDILFLGFSLVKVGNGSGTLLEWLREHYPTLKVVVISPYKNALLVRMALEAGAMGYIVRDCCEKTVQNTLRSLLNNKVFVQRGLMNAVLLHKTGSLAGQPLSPREVDVLRSLYEGLEQPEISSRMGLSNKTVSAHKIHAMEKLGVQSDCQLYCLMTVAQIFDDVI